MRSFGPPLTTDAKPDGASAGDLSLEFVNTGEWDPVGPWRERLERFRDLVRWARESGALLSERSARLLEVGERLPGRAEDTLQHARRVRRLIREVFKALAHHEPIQPDDLEALSHEVAAALASARFVDRGGRVVREWSADPEDLEQALRPIVVAAGDLLLGQHTSRLRECANPQCGRLFLDESRNGMRRWCDMRVCGSRAKARRYYARRTSVERGSMKTKPGEHGSPGNSHSRNAERGSR